MATNMALLTLTFSFLLAAANANSGVFRATMIRRTGAINFTQAARQSRHRLSMLASRLHTKTTTSSRVVDDAQIPVAMDGDGGAYDMEFSIGTPPQKLTAIVDTGSDLIWTKCGACTSCEPRGSPSYYPNNSSSFSKQPCSARLCRVLLYSMNVATCGAGGEECDYMYDYTFPNYTQGYLASETFTLGGDAVPGIGFGCTNMSEGFNGTASGVVGLSRSPVSLVSQLNASAFLYCLTRDASKTSPLLFGSSSLLTGAGVQSTPLTSDPSDSIYSVYLHNISIGDVTTYDYGLRYVLVDSSTTLTYLEDPLYSDAKNAVLLQTDLARAPDRDGFEACYVAPSDGTSLDKAVPSMVLHFDGADMALPVGNYFVDVGDGVVCWVVQLSPYWDQSIIGNAMQVDFHVMYDVNNSVLSFQPANCDNLPGPPGSRSRCFSAYCVSVCKIVPVAK
ncbi:hypothetical protein HU200_033719 [Digitaria exilis]|uniref:Peptidase A1 domain-containing protein n=1 Tax=Digitaria exilis TaxID=1010633 RepID=A0A835BHU6_9POAL|nr:hypothetical protein HU200_033719 [Digitaria exilis]